MYINFSKKLSNNHDAGDVKEQPEVGAKGQIEEDEAPFEGVS